MIDVHNITNISATLENKVVDITANLSNIDILRKEKVEDVKVNGESVVNDRIAEIDLPIVKLNDGYKIKDNKKLTTGELHIQGRLNTHGYTIDGLGDLYDWYKSDLINFNKIDCGTLNTNVIETDSIKAATDTHLNRLYVGSNANIDGSVNIKNKVTIDDILTVNYSATIGSNAKVGGALDVSGTLDVGNEFDVHGTADFFADVKNYSSVETEGTTRTKGDLITFKGLYPKETNKVNVGKATARYKNIYVNNIVGYDGTVIYTNDLLTNNVDQTVNFNDSVLFKDNTQFEKDVDIIGKGALTVDVNYVDFNRTKFILNDIEDVEAEIKGKADKSETVTMTAILTDGTTKTYTLYGKENV